MGDLGDIVQEMPIRAVRILQWSKKRMYVWVGGTQDLGVPFVVVPLWGGSRDLEDID
jgi:hypothetical protein